MKLHQPVLLEETISSLNLKSGEIVIDMTAGYGGHSAEILKIIGESGRLILVDRDNNAIRELRKKFGNYANVEYIHSNFADIDYGKIGRVDKILMDLGVSSPQLDESDRGFSFNKDAKLDMRMDQSQNLTAKDIVNDYTEDNLANIIYRYGEEKRSRKIASEIVKHREERPITTTKQLAATRTFQAIRIATNQELESIELALPDAVDSLKSRGRLTVISFHSLEDRIVKRFFRSLVEAQKDLVTGREIESPNFRLINKKPLKGSLIDDNPRARSAKLRTIEKIN
ncbi:MAG: 16S rRNA (cytosine(1402)-N(4))-methyltransferase RsmH [Patescibacteria group bacterium]|nr:16S rRNA (cytosine(1402)-N(4))-methyltransferase RsmH [Patescibacteria group bacterium]